VNSSKDRCPKCPAGYRCDRARGDPNDGWAKSPPGDLRKAVFLEVFRRKKMPAQKEMILTEARRIVGDIRPLLSLGAGFFPLGTGGEWPRDGGRVRRSGSLNPIRTSTISSSPSLRARRASPLPDRPASLCCSWDCSSGAHGDYTGAKGREGGDLAATTSLARCNPCSWRFCARLPAMARAAGVLA